MTFGVAYTAKLMRLDATLKSLLEVGKAEAIGAAA
jgi:hypothetical protein